MKAEMGCMRRAMTNARISFEKSPSGPKLREQPANGKQKNKFAGAARTKNKANRVAQRSLVHVQKKNAVSDSDDEPQPEYGNVAIVAKPKKKHVSPREMNAMLAGITKHRVAKPDFPANLPHFFAKYQNFPQTWPGPYFVPLCSGRRVYNSVP